MKRYPNIALFTLWRDGKGGRIIHVNAIKCSESLSNEANLPLKTHATQFHVFPHVGAADN